MKKFIFVIMVFCLFLTSCDKNNMYDRIETLNQTFDYTVYLYGDYPIGETESDNLPKNLVLHTIENLNVEVVGISAIIVNKSINDEELNQLNELLLNNLTIIFYHCEDYINLICDDKYEFKNLNGKTRSSDMIAVYDYKTRYSIFTNGTTYSLVDILEEWLVKYE